MDLDIAEVVDIIRQGGKFLISSDGGKITGLEKVRKNQFLLTIEEFKELAKEAGCIDETESKLQEFTCRLNNGNGASQRHGVKPMAQQLHLIKQTQ